jgi:hypothetical protein
MSKVSEADLERIGASWRRKFEEAKAAGDSAAMHEAKRQLNATSAVVRARANKR